MTFGLEKFGMKMAARRIDLKLAVPLFAVVLLGMLGLLAQPAHAQFTSGFDPAGQVVSFANSNQWLTKAQGWAKTIYLSLVIFEVIALGITTLLFRENLGEFFSSVALKIVLGSVFFWFISVAGPAVSNLPGAVMSTFGNTFGKGMGGTNDVTGLATEGLAASGLFFGASYAMREEDGNLAALAESVGGLNCTITVAAGEGGGVCYRQPSETIEYVRQVAELVTSGLGVMVGLAIAAVYLTFTLITIESYLVMTAGTLFIGFAGSRFTMPFSQGYFSYMISVGVKLMALYLAIGIVGPLMTTILESAIGTLLGALLDPTGVTALAAAAYGALSVVVGSGIISMVPGFAASFISGQSFASGAAALQQATSSFAGSAQMMAQLNSSSLSRQQASHDRESAHGVAQSMAMFQHGQVGTAGAGHGDSFAKNGSPASIGAGAGQQGVLGDTLGMQRPAAGQNGMRNFEATGRTEAIPAQTVVAATPADGRSARNALDGTDRSQDAFNRNDATKAVVESRNAQGNGKGGDGSAKIIGNVALPPSGVAPNRDRPTGADAAQSTDDDSYVDAPYQPVADGTVVSPSGQPMGVQMASGDQKSLEHASVAQLEAMQGRGDDINGPLSNTEWNDLKPRVQEWLVEHGYGESALSKYNEKATRESTQAELADGYALSGLSQAGIRDVGPPTAVQVRISAPDKL